MTEEELNRVHKLKKEIYDLKARRAELRWQAMKLASYIDGMPHSKNAKSRVEELTVKLVSIDEEIAKLIDMLVQSMSELDAAINSTELDALEKAVINLRYVACMKFEDIQKELNITEPTTFYIHRTAKKKILKPIKAD